MAIFRVEKSSNYTTMSNYHLKEKGMSLNAKGLMSLILSLPDEWDYSVAGLVTICKESEYTVKSALDELKQFGYLTVTKLMPNQTKSGRIEYIYDVYEKPKQEGEKQGLVSQGLETQGLVPQGIENQPQINTNIINTNILNTNNKKRSSCCIVQRHEITEDDLDIILNEWNSQKLTQPIQKIPRMSLRENNTRMCIDNDLESFIGNIRKIDTQGYFVEMNKKTGYKVKYDWFVDPNNYLKFSEGNYSSNYVEKDVCQKNEDIFEKYLREHENEQG